MVVVYDKGVEEKEFTKGILVKIYIYNYTTKIYL